MAHSCSTQTSAPVEVLGHRMQQALEVILGGLDDRDALSATDTEALRRDLRMLLAQEFVRSSALVDDSAKQQAIEGQRQHEELVAHEGARRIVAPADGSQQQQMDKAYPSRRPREPRAHRDPAHWEEQQIEEMVVVGPLDGEDQPQCNQDTGQKNSRVDQ